MSETLSAAALAEKTEWYGLAQEPNKQLAYIKQLGARIGRAFQPERVILFGSHAYGAPHAASDIDLLVVMEYPDSHTQAAIRILDYLDVLAPLDVLVRAPSEIAARLQLGDSFMREIVECGQVIYESDYPRVD